MGGEKGSIPGERGRGAPTLRGHGRGRGVRAPEHRDAPASLAGPGPEPPESPAAPTGPGHVLTGGNRALYFFFLLGISGPLSPRRAQRRRPQPPGPRACSSPARRGSPGSWCRPLRPRRCPQGPSAAGQDTARRARAPSPIEPPRRCASVPDSTATPARPQGQKNER